MTPPTTLGSTLMNSDSCEPRLASMAPRTAAARQAHSSSVRRPARRAAEKSATGLSRGESFGPRASASKATTSPERRSTIGW